jgi:membrane protein required for colicin V production
VALAVTFLGKSIKDSMDKTFLGKVDAIAGAFLGLVKFAFSISVALWLIDSMRIKIPSEWTRGSYLYPATAHFAPDVAAFLGGFLPFFKEVFT